MVLPCTPLTQIAVMFVIITAGILCSRFGVILEAARVKCLWRRCLL